MKNIRTLGILAPLAFALVFPLLIPDPMFDSIAIYTLLYAAAVTGWNLFSGYSGYISLGYASFTGIGGYTLALICDHWQIPSGYIPFLLLPVAGLATGIFAIPMGWVALRTRRVTFVVVTIAMMFVLQALAFNLSGFTSGSSGIIFPVTIWSGDFYNIPYYYVSLVLSLLAIAVSWWIRNSKYGLGLLAIRDDEDRALGLGVRTWAFKLSAFVISAFLGGMVGAMFAYYGGSIFPQSAFDRSINIAIPLAAFLGGLGTLSGPLIGALMEIPLQQYLTVQFGKQGWDLILYGVFFLLIILVLPEGIIPALSRRWSMWMHSPSKTNTLEARPIASNELSFALSQVSSSPDHNTSIGPIEQSASTTVSQRSWSPVPQGTTVQAVSNAMQQPYRVPSPIPRHRSIQPTTKELTQKVRVPRLVSVPLAESASRPATKTILPTTKPCPGCSEPLVVWGGNQFCTRCGFVPSHPKSPSQGGW